MLYKFALLTALAGKSLAQMNLTAALSSSPDLSTLAGIVPTIPGLLSSLANASNITILAPSNEAFAVLQNSSSASLLSNADQSTILALLQYHVLMGTYPASAIKSTPAFVPTMLNGSGYTNVTGGQVVEAVTQGSSVEIYSGLLQNSTVTMPNVNFTGGVVHVINRVLSIPQNISYTAQQAGLSALVGALTKANLVSALDDLKDVTIFAPSNDAFKAIGSATGNLTTEQLASILQYHVVNGTVGYSSKLMNGTSLKTLGGQNLTVRVENGDVFVNSAKVITPNVLVSNGVVHVIDNVLNPNNTSAMPSPSASTQPVAFSGASSASDIPLTSGVPSATATLGMAPSVSMMASSGSGGEGSASATSKSSSGIAMPMKTGAVGVAALFAGAGVLINA